MPFTLAELQVPPPMVVCASNGVTRSEQKRTVMQARFMRLALLSF
jgi:hypothetical protein